MNELLYVLRLNYVENIHTHTHTHNTHRREVTFPAGYLQKYKQHFMQNG